MVPQTSPCCSAVWAGDAAVEECVWQGCIPACPLPQQAPLTRGFFRYLLTLLTAVRLGTPLKCGTFAREGWISSRSKEKWASGYEHAVWPSVLPKYLSYRYHRLHAYLTQYSARDIWLLGWPLCPSWIKSLYLTNLLWRVFVNSAFKDKLHSW